MGCAYRHLRRPGGTRLGDREPGQLSEGWNMAQDTELKLLLGYLDAQRRHVLGILDGLDEEQLRKAPLPSGWTPRELVHHLALDDEAFWFRGTVAGQQEMK